MEKGKILIFDSQNTNLDQLFIQEGYSSVHADGFENATELAIEEKPVAILIDLDSCGADGWEVCRRLKRNYDTQKFPLVFVSSQGNENDIVKGFEMGGDDFVTKPFGSREMVARIKAIIRRIDNNDSKRLKVRDIEIDLDEHKVKKAGKPIDLTYIQFKLLYLLASRRDNVFTRREILERVWGKKVYVTNRTVDVHIKRLREKLGEYKYPSQYIETIHGTGYRFL